LETQLSKLLNEKTPTSIAKWTGTPTKNCVLTNNSMTCTVVATHGQSALFMGSEGWTTGVHQWTVECDIQEANVMVGISKYVQPSERGRSIYRHSGGYFIFTANGCKYSQTMADVPTNPPLIRQTSDSKYKLKVRLDCDKRTLFFANEVDKSGSDIWVIGYEGLSMDHPYYPTVELIYINHRIAVNPQNSVTYIPEY